MRVRSLMVLALSLAALSADSIVIAEEIDTPPGAVLNINCDKNTDTVVSIRESIGLLLETAKPMQAARTQKQLSEESNAQLFVIETTIAERLVVLSAHEYAQFYCDNPELLKKQNEPPPVNPAAVA